MAFPLDNKFLGPPNYGPRKGTEGVIFHTTEGVDSSMAAAKATAQWQKDSGASSYNFILTDDGPLLTVPEGNSSGGITLLRTNPPWAPGRFPWIKQLLSPAAYDDVNAYHLQVSVSGKTSRLQSYAQINRIIDDAARILLWAEAKPGWSNNLVVTGHMYWQTDRSDPSQWFIDQVMARYAAILNPPVPPTPPPLDPCADVKTQLAKALSDLSSANQKLEVANARIQVKDQALDQIIFVGQEDAVTQSISIATTARKQ